MPTDLYRLSGSIHYCVIREWPLWRRGNGRFACEVAVSAVRMKKLPIDRVAGLVAAHLDKAGAYAIQERRNPIARVIRVPTTMWWGCR